MSLKYDFNIPKCYDLQFSMDFKDFKGDGSKLKDVEDYIDDKYGSLEIHKKNEKQAIKANKEKID